MKEIQQAGGIVINKQGQVVIVQNNMGRWTFPKGGQEPGEELEDTVRREIREETGINSLEIVQKLGVISRQGFIYPDTKTPVTKHINIFWCTTDQEQLQPELSDAVQAIWVKPDVVAGILSWPQESEFFESNRAKIGL